MEETGLDGEALVYLFQFGGLHKRYHVFLFGLAATIKPEPGNEIVQCRRFSLPEIALMPTSIPTLAIVRLYEEFESRDRRRGETRESHL